MSDGDFLNARRKALEDSFFAQRDQELLKQLHERLQEATQREALAMVSGIEDEEVLDFLLRLNLSSETAAALTLVPLIEVAWADGNISDEERQAILDAASNHGVADDAPCCQLLESWLTAKPDPRLLRAWEQYVEALRGTLSADDLSTLADKVLGHAEAVASAAGGVLGIGKVSPSEKKVLGELRRVLQP
ncbi:MAG: hypothetical protein R3E01_34995 [Pirellulaceae bacterium]